MQPKQTLSTLANALFGATLLLSIPPASAHHEGGRHDVEQAAEPRQAGARLAATCTGCHGTDGRTVGDALPALAGQPKEALLASLMAFKSGERSATVMTQLAKGYSDADLEQIAAFFAAQPESGQSAAEQPAAGQPAAGQPAVGQPAVGQPAREPAQRAAGS